MPYTILVSQAVKETIEILILFEIGNLDDLEEHFQKMGCDTHENSKVLKKIIALKKEKLTSKAIELIAKINNMIDEFNHTRKKLESKHHRSLQEKTEGLQKLYEQTINFILAILKNTTLLAINKLLTDEEENWHQIKTIFTSIEFLLINQHQFSRSIYLFILTESYLLNKVIQRLLTTEQVSNNEFLNHIVKVANELNPSRLPIIEGQLKAGMQQAKVFAENRLERSGLKLSHPERYHEYKTDINNIFSQAWNEIERSNNIVPKKRLQNNAISSLNLILPRQKTALKLQFKKPSKEEQEISHEFVTIRLLLYDINASQHNKKLTFLKTLANQLTVFLNELSGLKKTQALNALLSENIDEISVLSASEVHRYQVLSNLFDKLSQNDAFLQSVASALAEYEETQQNNALLSEMQMASFVFFINHETAKTRFIPQLKDAILLHDGHIRYSLADKIIDSSNDWRWCSWSTVPRWELNKILRSKNEKKYAISRNLNCCLWQNNAIAPQILSKETDELSRRFSIPNNKIAVIG